MRGDDAGQILPASTRISREITCGITYLDIVGVSGEGVSLREGARRLGISEPTMYRWCKRLSLTHWFERSYELPRCITPEDIAQLASEGYTQKDAASLAGVSANYFKKLVQDYNLAHLFPNSGEAARISILGYCAKRMTWDKVRAIRQSDLSNNELAGQYGIPTDTVYRIRRGSIWKE